MANQNPKWVNLITTGTYVVSTGACNLERIIVNTSAAALITILDGKQVSGAKPVGIMQASVPCGTYVFDIALDYGLTIVLAGASNITVVYK